MDPKSLVQLAAVVELGSLSRAANRLNLTQPTLTRSIKQIEDRAGAPVLRRERYGVVPTQLGELLAERGRVIASELDVTQEMVKLWHAGLTDEINLAMTASVADLLGHEFLALSLREDWPYSISLIVGAPSTIMTQLAGGDIDLAISRADIRTANEGLEAIPYFKDEEIAIAGRHSPLAEEGASITPDAVGQARWISQDDGNGMQDGDLKFISRYAGKTVRPAARIQGDMRSIRSLLQNTDACVVLPRRLWSKFDRPDGCRVLPIPADRALEKCIWRVRSQADRPEVQHCIERLHHVLNKIIPAQAASA